MYKLLIRLRSGILVYLTHNMALPMLKLFRKEKIFPYAAAELKAFPEQTVGRELIEMLEVKELELLPYYARHDIKHILLQYDTTDEGEVCLQCFMLGNRHASFPVLATVVYGLLTMPEHWPAFRRAFKRGRNTEGISNWKWFEILHEPVQKLRQKINSPTQNLK